MLSFKTFSFIFWIRANPFTSFVWIWTDVWNIVLNAGFYRLFIPYIGYQIFRFFADAGFFWPSVLNTCRNVFALVYLSPETNIFRFSWTPISFGFVFVIPQTTISFCPWTTVSLVFLTTEAKFSLLSSKPDEPEPNT